MFNKDEVIYYLFGKQYHKLDRNEIIKKDAVYSFCNFELRPILNPDIVGHTPSEFDDEEDFYNLI